MILTDREILQAIETKDIVIEPFKPESLGTNSYDVHLSKYLAPNWIYRFNFSPQVEEEAAKI